MNILEELNKIQAAYDRASLFKDRFRSRVARVGESVEDRINFLIMEAERHYVALNLMLDAREMGGTYPKKASKEEVTESMGEAPVDRSADLEGDFSHAGEEGDDGKESLLRKWDNIYIEHSTGRGDRI